MAEFLKMPKLSDTMTEGTLIKWLKKEGDPVEVGDVLAEIETDKATMEMEVFDEGTIHKLLIEEGGKAPIGSLIAIILGEDEAPPTDAEIAAGGSGSTATAEAPAADDEAQAETSGSTVAAPATTAVVSNTNFKASPLAKKIAATKGIDLSTVSGTGPGGRIVKADVEGATAGGAGSAGLVAAGAGAAGVACASPAAATITVPALEGDQSIPLSGMRKIIAERLLASKTQIPHFYLNTEVDAAPLMSVRKQINESSEKVGGNKYSVNDFVLKAVVSAAKAVPAVNASWGGDCIIQHSSVGLSVAISVDDGLVTPVILDADSKTLLQISQEVKDLAEKSRTKKLSPNAFDGGTITVSNLGAWGIDSFSAIINPPQAIILSIGSISKKPVVNAAGEIVAGLRMNIGLSGDHRVVDGAVAAAYLAEMKKLIENPALMLI